MNTNTFLFIVPLCLARQWQILCQEADIKMRSLILWWENLTAFSLLSYEMTNDTLLIWMFIFVDFEACLEASAHAFVLKRQQNMNTFIPRSTRFVRQLLARWIRIVYGCTLSSVSQLACFSLHMALKFLTCTTSLHFSNFLSTACLGKLSMFLYFV